MKIPKQTRRHCPKCGKHTEQKVTQNKARGRSSAHPLSAGSTKRIRLRGERRGSGNLGRYSKPPKPKMTGKKMTKKTDLRYTCSECKRVWYESVRQGSVHVQERAGGLLEGCDGGELSRLFQPACEAVGREDRSYCAGARSPRVTLSKLLKDLFFLCYHVLQKDRLARR